MMLERTQLGVDVHSLRMQPRSFRAWSGSALSRFFDKTENPEPQQQGSARRRKRHSDSSSEEEMSKRKDQLQKLLQQVDTERLKQEKKMG
jgi:hypothetical protein